MKLLFRILGSIIGEILVVFLLLFVLNNFIGKSKETIKADAVGYYDYLPSLFIHKDICRYNKPFDSNPSIYTRIQKMGNYLDYNGYKVNKYPIGTAVLEAPFFIATYATITLKNNEKDGYQPAFHQSVFYAAVFYLFLGLYFLKKLLKLYNINNYLILFLQLLLTLGTNITIYSNFDAGYSHVYSFFAITAFAYFTKLYFQKNSFKSFYYACLFLGLIIILRQVNLLILFFIPFLAGSFEKFNSGFKILFKNYKKLLIGISILICVVFIQLYFWFLQTGSFFVYSYQGEGFNFLNPEFINVLFSYNRGLFVYTPIILLFSLSSIWFFFKKYYWLGFSWIFFFLTLTYVLSSWWSWNYGCCFGLRPFIDYYSIFVIPFAIMLSRANKFLAVIIILFSSLAIPINIIQSFQYKNFIIDWCNMNEVKYWNSFLQVESQFRGYAFNRDKSIEGNTLIKEYKIDQISIGSKNHQFEFKLSTVDTPELVELKKIRIIAEDDFNQNLDCEVTVLILDNSTNEVNYWYKTYLLHFSETPNKKQTGIYNFIIEKPIENSSDLTIEFSPSEHSTILKNVKVQLFK